MLIYRLYNGILGPLPSKRKTTPASSKNFVIGLTTAKDAISEAIDTRSLAPIQRIIAAGQYKTTISILRPALQLLQGRNLGNLSMVSNRVLVPYPGGVTTVEFDAILDSSTNELIFLGSTARMAEEMGIFEGLIANFHPVIPMGQFTDYVYWVLRKTPSEVSIPRASVVPRGRQEIVDAVFQLMNPTSSRLVYQTQRISRPPQSPPPPPQPHGVSHPPSP